MAAERYPRNLSTLSNQLNNEVVMAAGRFEQALDTLELWIAEHPDSRHLVVMSRGLLERCGRMPEIPDDAC